jgi:hypothetical protein
VVPFQNRIGRYRGLDIAWGSVSEDREQMVIEATSQRLAVNKLPRRAFCLEIRPDSDYPLTYSIQNVNVDSLFSGHRLAPQLYRYLLRRMDGLILRGGPDQSPGGRYIWYHLAQYHDVIVYALNEDDHSLHQVTVDPQSREVCLVNKTLYGSAESYSLFACAAG